MKKKVVATLLVLTMAAGLFAGCGGGGDEKEPAAGGAGNAADAGAGSDSSAGSADGSDSAGGSASDAGSGGASDGKVIEITWMHHFQEAGIQAWVDDIITKFEAENPNIKVTTEVLGADSYDQTLKTKIASDDAPMIFDLGGYAYYKEYGDAGHLYDLTGMEGLSNIDPEVLPAGQVDGKQYAISTDQNAYAVFYNKDMFEEYGLEVPKTHDEFIKVCDTLLENGIQPIAAGYQEQWCTQCHFDIIASPWYGDNEWWTKKMDLSSSFSDDAAWKGFVQQFYDEKKYWGDDPFGTNWDTAQNMMANGEAAMILNGSWTIDGVTGKNPDIKVGVFAYPTTNNPDEVTMQMRPGNGFCLYNSQDPDKLEAGKKFINFMCSLESGQSFANHASKLSTVEGVDLSFSEPLSEIMAYEKVWSTASVKLFTSEYQQLTYETLTNYVMEDTLDVDGLAESLDADFAAIGK